MTLVFGSSTSSFNGYAVGQGNSRQFQDKINHLVLYFVYLFAGRFVIGYVATLCICVAAARTTNSLRKAFLESLLRQEVSHFDMHGNESAATQVTTSTSFSTRPRLLLTWYVRWPPCQSRHCRETIHLVMGISLFFSAYIVALSVQWKLALITMSIATAILLVVGGCVGIDAPIEARIVSRGAFLARQCVPNISCCSSTDLLPRSNPCSGRT
jgi:ATP-binding cassette, subfamily B (MDR/TAP), member 1